MKILIIEDDQLVANIYRNKFAVEGFQTETARDGEIGLEMVRRFRPDAILLDLMLPKVSGIDVMKQIRAEADFKSLPIVVFSNTYLTNVVQEAWNAGATKCLSKANCTPKHVIDAIRSALKQKSPAEKTNTESDEAFQAELRREFIGGLPATLNTLRTQLQAMVKATDEATRLKQINELYRRVHALTSNASIVGMKRIVQLADAVEALLKELYEKPKNINVSTLRTVAAAVDFLGVLFEKADSPEESRRPAEILVVDDEAISRRAIIYALDKAKLKSTAVEDPLQAYQLLQDKSYDLIFLDVDMPNMNGFELCSRLRTLPAYKKVPVVFVTGLDDLESRAHSTMSGGNDFIAKPFLFIELAVKAIVHVMRGEFESAKAGAAKAK